MAPVRDSILALLAGSACGAVFALFELPAPSPPVLSGVIGIFGVWLGYQVVQWLR